MTRDIRTPSELNHEVRLHLETGFGQVWLEGEISNLSRPASGHCYFSLKDDRAQVRCALFRSQARAATMELGNGLQVLARGRVTLYEPRGDYQLIVDRIEAAGEGALRAAFEALRQRLQSEGLFDEARKRPLPRWPRRVAVVTSPSGAVIRDILHVLERRWPLAEVRLYPAPVQGEDAPAALLHALQAVNRHAWAEVVVLARGGGSLEDLWAFNDEALTRAVFASATPVISAVGHESDFSMTDFAADQRAPTPSAAAEMLSPDGPALATALNQHLGQMLRSWRNNAQRRAQQLDHLAHRLGQCEPGRRLARHRELLASLGRRLRTAGSRQTSQRRAVLDALDRRLHQRGRLFTSARRQQLAALARTLHAVSPLPTLERGYAVVTDSETDSVVTRIAQGHVGQSLRIRLIDGRLHATVEDVRAADADAPGERDGEAGV